MKKLEKRIINKIYKIETKKTLIDLMLKILFGIFLGFSILIMLQVIYEILSEQHSFDLLSFFKDNFDVVNKYFFPNLYNFYQELPQPLFYILLTGTILLLVLIGYFIKNFNKIRNKLISLYKFWFK
jgi:hypothetical protein